MEQRVIRLAEKIVDGLQTVPYCDAVKVHTSVGDAEAKFVKSWLDAREGGYKLKRAMEWTPSDLSAWMEAKGKNIAKYSSSFLKGKIDGFTLLAVTDAVLEEEYGIATSHHRARLRGELAEQVERDSTRPVGPSITSLTEAELQDYIMDLFLAADLDGNGVLDREEMRLVLSATYLNLSKKEMHHIMAEADEDDNGVIDFSEFVPLMVNLVKMTKAKEMAQKLRADAEAEAREKASVLLLHGMPRDELEQTISNIFSEADKDGNGKLDRMEFKACLRSAELGLTRKEINVILSNVDLDSDGCISYNEFIPCCFDLLVERFKEDLLASNSLNSADGIVQMLLKAFAEKDEVNEGKLPLKEVKHTLQELAAESFGLSRMQLVVIMAEAKID
ncbi:hypothetical protein CYMTET_5407, partial [Cymbomonas tetramitiformis]